LGARDPIYAPGLDELVDLTASDRARLNAGVEEILSKESFEPARLVEIVRQVGAKARRLKVAVVRRDESFVC
jgi:hypothetical protein